MVELNKKVTLRTKATETSEEVQKPQVALKKKQPVSETVPPTPPKTGGEEETKGGKGKWYAAALAGLIVLGGGGYYLSQQGDEDDAPVAEVVEPAKSADVAGGETTEPNQDEQNPTDADDEVADATSNEAAEGGAPAQPGQSHGDATPAKDNATTAPATDVSVRNNPSTGGTVSQTNPTPTASVTGAVEEEAREVIRGKYGNGAVRKRNLGDRYAEIQSKVNEMYRNGQVH